MWRQCCQGTPVNISKYLHGSFFLLLGLFWGRCTEKASRSDFIPLSRSLSLYPSLSLNQRIIMRIAFYLIAYCSWLLPHMTSWTWVNARSACNLWLIYVQDYIVLVNNKHSKFLAATHSFQGRQHLECSMTMIASMMVLYNKRMRFV